MAKEPAAARFTTEVAPPQVVSIMRRRKVPRSLDTIAEDEREHQQQQLAYGTPDHRHSQTAPAANPSGFFGGGTDDDEDEGAQQQPSSNRQGHRRAGYEQPSTRNKNGSWLHRLGKVY